MKNTKHILLTLILGSIMISPCSQANEKVFCSVYKDKLELDTYVVPDGTKPYSVLDKEVRSLEAQKEKALRQTPVDQTLVDDLTTLIDKKKSIMSLKVNYQAKISDAKNKVSILMGEKNEIHSKALQALAIEDPADRAAELSRVCGVYASSPYYCKTESDKNAEISNAKNELNELKKDFNYERKWVSRTIAPQMGKENLSLSKLKSASSGLLGMVLKPGSMSLNKDGDGSKGNLTSITNQYYSCDDQKLTEYPKKAFIPSLPLVIQKTQGGINILFCEKTFLGEGDCGSVKDMLDPNSGWESVTIARETDEYVNAHNDHIGFKSHCQDLGTSLESCILEVKTVAMGDVDKDNISTKTASILSGNPSYNKIVGTATSSDFNNSFNSAKKEMHNESGCSYQTIDKTSSSENEESAVIQCNGYEKDENGRVIKQLSPDGTEQLARKEVSQSVNLLDCPIVEKCLSEKEEEITYDEGCVSPFPLDQVVIKTDVPEGNCALKFDKESYTCTAKRVMQTRSCHIKKKQKFETCSSRITTAYTEIPSPKVVELSAGRQSFRFQKDEDLDAKQEMSPDEYIKSIMVHDAHRGSDYFTVNRVFFKRDVGKYAVFKVMTYHRGSHHSQRGFGGESQRRWGWNKCREGLAFSWGFDDDEMESSPVLIGDNDASSTNCGNLNWFVINLEDESGGRIDPPTWTPPAGYGNVIEVSRKNSGGMPLGPYSHSTNQRRCGLTGCGGSPDEYSYTGEVSVIAPNPGQDWCSPVEDQRVISNDPDNGQIFAPYAACSIQFKHSGWPNDLVCPSGAGTVQFSTGDNILCGNKENAEPISTNGYVAATSWDETRGSCAYNNDWCYDDDDYRYRCRKTVGKVVNECVLYSPQNGRFQVVVFGNQSASYLPVNESFCTTYDKAVADNQVCEAEFRETLGDWQAKDDAYNTCLSNAAAANQQAVDDARAAYDASVAAESENNPDYQAPPFQAPETTPPTTQCASQHPGDRPVSDCSLAKYGWDHPYSAKHLTFAVNGRNISCYSGLGGSSVPNVNSGFFFSNNILTGGVPAGGRMISFLNMIIPHLDIKKVVDSEANSCLNFNGLRDDETTN